MSVFKIQNWKFGLDTRRSELTSQPGTLETAENVHINQGAEIEKRKAFVLSGINAFSSNVFGLDVASGSLVAFGSAAVESVTVPTNVTYVQCAHPTDTSIYMTALICSCEFGGQAFCIAKFSDGNYFWFLNGNIIPASMAGQVFTVGGSVQTTAQIAKQMWNILSGSAFVNAGITVDSMNNAGTGFNISTAYGVTWAPVTTITPNPNGSGSGTITTALLSTGVAPVAASTGAGVLTLYAGTTGSVTLLNVVTPGNTYKLLSTAVSFNTNVVNTIAALASAITTQHASSLLVTTWTSTNILNIQSSLTTLPSNHLQYSVTGNLCFENLSLDFSGVANSTSVQNIYTTNGTNVVPVGSTYGANGSLSGTPTGSDPGYKAFTLPYGTYIWIPGANDTKLVVRVNGAGVDTTFLASNYPQGVAIQNWSTGDFNLWGKGSTLVTAKVYAATDVLASSGINYTGASSLTTIAAAIVTANKGWVASNTDISGSATTTLYLSRKSLAITQANEAAVYVYTTIPGIAPAGFGIITPPTNYGISQATPAVIGSGTTYSVIFGGTWAIGDQYVFDIVASAVTYTVGTGNLTGLVPAACITLSNRVHVIAGSNWLGSDNGDATQWEQQAAGAFSIDVSQQFRQADKLVSLAAYQGRMALFANYVTMIWVLDANPLSIAMQQALANIGTFSSLGPQSLGDFDIVFPCVTGFRSLRVRDLSLNAYVNDLGSPVDLLVQADINSVGLGNLASSCGIVEPSANRYWLYLNGKIYVLSYFPSAKINAAWSVYTPTFVSQGTALGGGSGTVNVTIGNLYYYSGTGTVSTSSGQLIQSGTGYFISTVSQVVTAGAGTLYNGVKITFTPIKFVIYNSQVYFIASFGGAVYLFVFGGANNITYDGTLATVATPWLDMESPTFRKVLTSLDFAMTNVWQFFLSMDYYGYVNKGGQLRAVTAVPVSNPSYQLGSYAISEDGYHVKLQASCSASGYSVLSALELNYQRRGEKK